MDRRMGGPQSWSGQYEEVKILNNQLLGCPAHSQLLYHMCYSYFILKILIGEVKR
jgi:hypothetical protein